MNGRLVWIEEIETGLSDDSLAGLVRSRYGSFPDPAIAVARALSNVLLGYVSVAHGQEAVDAALTALGVPFTQS